MPSFTPTPRERIRSTPLSPWWTGRLAPLRRRPFCFKIVVGEPQPPPPPPARETTGVVIYELDDPSQQRPEYAQIMYGPSIRKLLEGRWHCVDDDVSGQLPPFVAAALAAVKAEKLPEPHLFLFDQDGRQIHRGPLPGSVEAAAAKIREFPR